MSKVTTKIDSKSRITLPKEIKEALGAGVGDTLFLTADESRRVRIVRAVEDPIAMLAEHAEQEYTAGKTRDLRELARELE